MNKLLKTYDERKRRRCDKIIQKDTIIPVEIHQTKKNLCYSSTKTFCKLEFTCRLWISFIDLSQSDIVVFPIINFRIYNLLVKK